MGQGRLGGSLDGGQGQEGDDDEDGIDEQDVCDVLYGHSGGGAEVSVPPRL